jgi:hypothetical protein
MTLWRTLTVRLATVTGTVLVLFAALWIWVRLAPDVVCKVAF